MRFPLVLLTCMLIACNTKQVSQDIQAAIPKAEKIDFLKPYPELVERINRKDSTKLNNYFKLVLATDSTCKIEWGNSKVKRVTADDYHFHIAGRFWFEWENEEFLTLRAGIGTGAWFSLILPLDSFARETTIQNTLAQNEKKNLVVAEQFPGTDTIMYIVNLKTNETQYITDKARCEAANHDCLDTVALSNKYLYYKWSTPHRFMDNPKTVERKVAVKI